MIATQNPKTGNETELLRSLGKLVRGLSALFWGLPAALLACAETARFEFLKPAGIVPALVTNALLLFGLWQMGSFQKQERPWRSALDRAKLLALINVGLCPFLYWQNKMPREFFFNAMIFLLIISSLLFLLSLNVVLKRLGAMLPDETLQQETRQFTLINRWLLVLWLVFVVAAVIVPQWTNLPLMFNPKVLVLISRAGVTVLLFLGLSPLAITMALIWKTKETILDSVFGMRN